MIHLKLAAVVQCQNSPSKDGSTCTNTAVYDVDFTPEIDVKKFENEAASYFELQCKWKYIGGKWKCYACRCHGKKRSPES